MKAKARYQFPTKKTKTKCVTLLIANSLKVHVSVFGDASYQRISLNSCFDCGLQVQPCTSHVRNLTNRDQWKSTWLSCDTGYNDSEHYHKRCAKTKATARYGTISQGWSFLYNGSGLSKHYPRKSPGKYSFFHLSLTVSMSLHYIFTFCFTNSKLGAVSLSFKNLRERVTVREICKSVSSEA